MSRSDTRMVGEVADRLFDAIERSDIDLVEQLFSPGIAVWKSGDTEDNDQARSVKIIRWFVDATVNRRYEVLDRQMFDGGFVQQHVLHAGARTGATIAMRVCIVIKVGGDGLITRIDEYFDPAEITPLLSQTSS